jgi:hypothetical protein
VKNTIQNTSGTTRTAFGAKRLVIGAASVVAAGALVGVGAQGAFAATGDAGTAGSGSAAVSTPAPGSASAGGSLSLSAHAGWSAGDLGHDLFSGHVDGAKAQALAKRIVADAPLLSLLPDSLQGDLKTLAGASAQDRTADAKKVVSTALSGGYGTAIQKLATQLKDAASDRGGRGDHSDLDLKGLLDGLRSGSLTGGDATGSGVLSQLTADASGVASAVTGDSQLAAKLPDSLRSDLTQLASAPVADRAADVQKIAGTALGGGYGAQVQQLADQVQQQVAAAH